MIIDPPIGGNPCPDPLLAYVSEAEFRSLDIDPDEVRSRCPWATELQGGLRCWRRADRRGPGRPARRPEPGARGEGPGRDPPSAEAGRALAVAARQTREIVACSEPRPPGSGLKLH